MNLCRYSMCVLALFLFSCGGGKPEQERSTGSLVLSIDPSSGEGRDKIFALTFANSGGPPATEMRLLINTDMDGRGACYVYYNREQNTFALVNDAGAGSTPLPVGDARAIENSQCRLDGAQSSAQLTGDSPKLMLSLRFKPSFAGKKTVYLYGENSAGASSGLQARGTWTVP